MEPGALRLPKHEYLQISSFEELRPLNKQNDILPDRIDYRSELLPPRDQLNQLMCVPFACAALKEFQENINVQQNSYFSPQYIYDKRSDVNGSQGMYVSEALNILRSNG